MNVQSTIIINNRKKKEGMEFIAVEFINEVWDDGKYIKVWDIHYGKRATGITKINRNGVVRYAFHGAVYADIEEAIRDYKKRGPHISRTITI